MKSPTVVKKTGARMVDPDIGNNLKNRVFNKCINISLGILSFVIVRETKSRPETLKVKAFAC